MEHKPRTPEEIDAAFLGLAKRTEAAEKAYQAATAGIARLDERTVDLANANQVITTTQEFTAAAMERIMAQHTRAFGLIAGLFVELGLDLRAPALVELRRIFDLPGPETN